eukprot:symbB.v1.2.004412.t1/scaffold237.1/size257402/2
MVGVSHRQIRQKFLMSFMSAAERLNVPFVPLQLMQNFCDDCEVGAMEAMSTASRRAEEVTLEDLLPDPDDMLERGKELPKELGTALNSWMLGRSSSLLVALLAVALLATQVSFVPVAETVETPRSELRLNRAETAMLGAALAAAPEVAHAGNSGYALLQLGWAVFIISLGPAVLFWVYFNKPELL